MLLEFFFFVYRKKISSVKQASYDASASQQELFSTQRQQQQQQQQRQRKVKTVPHNAETHNFERVNTVHYYEYIQAQPNSSNSPELPPLPIPNMTENVSYGQARSDSNERYNTSPSSLNRNDSQRPVEGGTNWSGKSYEEEREGYVYMNPNLPSSANSSQMVMYI